MRVGVTGGNGFIGGHVLATLAEHGHEAVVFDRHHNPNAPAGFFLGDVRDAEAVTEFAAHVDGIIHLAAVLGTQETIGNPRPAAETNIIGAVNVLNACDQYRLPLVNICVGNYWMRNTYSSTKRCAERLLEQYRDNKSLAACNVRVVNAYGPGQVAAAPYGPAKVRKIMPAFICRALTGAPVEIYGDGRQISDMVWVGDVAEALVKAVEVCGDGFVPPVTVEVGPGEHHNVAEIAQAVMREVKHLHGECRSALSFLPMRPGETVGRPVVANNATMGHLDLHPDDLLPLSAGVELTVQWFDAMRGITWHG